jgi:hypothetical protein
MDKIKQTLITAMTQAEIEHRRYQVAERYGNAAYHQGKRDAFKAALAIVAAGDIDTAVAAAMDKARAESPIPPTADDEDGAEESELT